MSGIIRTKSVSKHFKNAGIITHVLQDIDITIQQGEFVALTGPSGCGKSTLLSLLGLLDVVTDGEYYLEGENVAEFGDELASEIRNKLFGFVFQSFQLISHLSVAENVALPLANRNGVSKKVREDRALECLEKVGLADKAKSFPMNLSGGQQQRVAIARALSGKPKILFADEPTGNLDSENSRLILEQFKALVSEGITLVMVTHNPNELTYADRAINMTDGKIVR